ncbi:hypothetical protein ElyMa_005326800 [Elysia marginata]|uniref:Uncharacterized protein n=1 Tax=Elysia marginata TaxID=1093978 RepID=A0AAV4K215_9GAST|nr:hypothetical protein ElyMa_005326800 [Elysia marginata]
METDIDMEIYADPTPENVTQQKPMQYTAPRTPLTDVRNLAHNRFDYQITPRKLVEQAQSRRSKRLEPLTLRIASPPTSSQSLTKDLSSSLCNLEDLDVGAEIVLNNFERLSLGSKLQLPLDFCDEREVGDFSAEQSSQNLVKTPIPKNHHLYSDHTYLTSNFWNELKHDSEKTNVTSVIDSCVGTDTVFSMIDKCIGPDECSKFKDVGSDALLLSVVTDTCVGTDAVWDELAPLNLVDVSMVTEDAVTLDSSMLAIPDCLSRETMTESHMTDTASSMTPFKLGKHGSRLTAEEVRRQHPRVIANQIDAVMLSNQRLEKQVKSLEKEKTLLKTALKESKSALHDCETSLAELKKSLEDKQQMLSQQENVLMEERMKCWNAEETLQSNTLELERKCHDLERLRLESELSFAEELERFQKEAEANSYKTQFQSAQQKIQELQAVEREYLQLASEVEKAHSLQDHLRKAMLQLKATVNGLVKDKLQLQTENENLKKSCVSKEVDLDVLRFINQELLSDNENMKELVPQSEKCIAELEGSLKSANAAISQLQEELSRRLVDIADVTEAKEELRREKALMIIQLSEQQDSETVALQALEEAETELSKTEEALANERAVLAAGKEMHEKMKVEFEEKTLKLEMEVQHLEELLDKCELKRDAQEQELFECQEQLYTLQDIKTVFDNTTQDVDSGVSAMENLQEQMEALILTLNRKIDKGKSKHQSFEIRSSTPKNEKHSRRSFVAQVLSNLNQSQRLGLMSSKYPHDLTMGASYSSHRHHKQQSNVEFGASSTKSGVAAAALLSPHSQSFCGVASNHKTAVMTAAPSSSRKSVSFSEPGSRRALFVNSVVAEDQASPDKQCGLVSMSALMSAVEEDKHSATPGFARIKSIPLTKAGGRIADAGGLEGAEISGKSCGTLMGSSPLSDKVQTLAQLFSQVLKAVELVDRQAYLSIKDGQEELEFVKEQLRHEEAITRDLQADVEKKSKSLDVLNSRQKELQNRVSEMTTSLLTFHDQSLQISRLEEEKRDMKWKMADLEGQCSLLSDHLEAVVKKLDAAMAGQAGQAQCDGEISGHEVLALKKRNHELMVKLQAEQEQYRDLGDKAVQRMKLLESNWKKAESEVRRLDELIEDVREGCVSSQAQSTHPLILDIVRVIDGKLPSLARAAKQKENKGQWY